MSTMTECGNNLHVINVSVLYVSPQTWDDVERKTKQVDTPFEYKKRVVLDQEKSKLSLGEIYEAEFVKQTQTDDGEVKVGSIIFI